MTTRFAHISDLHIGPLVGFSPRHWTLKRALGYLNWRRKRQHIHKPEVIDRLVADITCQSPDHWLITGDLVNLGLPAEIERAAEWLAAIGPPDLVSVVPGNHDIYSRLWTDVGVARWSRYMASDDWGASLEVEPGTFPYVRRIGDIAIVGLNSAVPTPPGIASGLLGWRQCRALDRILRALGEAGLFRLILLHHAPLTGLADAHHRLRDTHELEGVLADAGAELVIYGHEHRNSLRWFEGGTRRVAIVGIGSGSSSRAWHGEGLGRYNLYDISRRPGGWLIELTGRGLGGENAAVMELARETIEV